MKQLKQLGNQIAQVITKAVKLELQLQGHRLTGALENSIEDRVRATLTGVRIEIEAERYARFVNRGVPASRIPFGGRRARRSKYIEGLKRFARLRFGVTQAEALRIAFAIARKHKKEGMPTKNSRRFSKTGKRIEAVDDALNKAQPKINQLTQEAFATVVGLIIEQRI